MSLNFNIGSTDKKRKAPVEPFNSCKREASDESKVFGALPLMKPKVELPSLASVVSAIVKSENELPLLLPSFIPFVKNENVDLAIVSSQSQCELPSLGSLLSLPIKSEIPSVKVELPSCVSLLSLASPSEIVEPLEEELTPSPALSLPAPLDNTNVIETEIPSLWTTSDKPSGLAKIEKELYQDMEDYTPFFAWKIFRSVNELIEVPLEIFKTLYSELSFT
jgi:hypothetical protein